MVGPPGSGALIRLFGLKDMEDRALARRYRSRHQGFDLPLSPGIRRDCARMQRQRQQQRHSRHAEKLEYALGYDPTCGCGRCLQAEMYGPPEMQSLEPAMYGHAHGGGRHQRRRGGSYYGEGYGEDLEEDGLGDDDDDDEDEDDDDEDGFSSGRRGRRRGSFHRERHGMQPHMSQYAHPGHGWGGAHGRMPMHQDRYAHHGHPHQLSHSGGRIPSGYGDYGRGF